MKGKAPTSVAMDDGITCRTYCDLLYILDSRIMAASVGSAWHDASGELVMREPIILNHMPLGDILTEFGGRAANGR